MSIQLEQSKPSSGGAASTAAYVQLQGQLSSGSSGGTGTGAAWTASLLNTTVTDSGSNLVSLASNQFVLKAGTYRLKATHCFYATSSTGISLYNTTTTARILGSTGLVLPDPVGGNAELNCRFVSNGTDVYEIDYFIASAAFGSALGSPLTRGVPEVYVDAVFEKE